MNIQYIFSFLSTFYNNIIARFQKFCKKQKNNFFVFCICYLLSFLHVYYSTILELFQTFEFLIFRGRPLRFDAFACTLSPVPRPRQELHSPLSARTAIWLRRQDSNLRHLTYEDSELPLLYSAICYGDPSRLRSDHTGMKTLGLHQLSMRPLSIAIYFFRTQVCRTEPSLQGSCTRVQSSVRLQIFFSPCQGQPYSITLLYRLLLLSLLGCPISYEFLKGTRGSVWKSQGWDVALLLRVFIMLSVQIPMVFLRLRVIPAVFMHPPITSCQHTHMNNQFGFPIQKHRGEVCSCYHEGCYTALSSRSPLANIQLTTSISRQEKDSNLRCGMFSLTAWLPYLLPPSSRRQGLWPCQLVWLRSV